jgi:hypothetical protein
MWHVWGRKKIFIHGFREGMTPLGMARYTWEYDIMMDLETWNGRVST